MRRIRFSCLQATFCRLKETVTLTQAIHFVKRVRFGCASQHFVACEPGVSAFVAGSTLTRERLRCIRQDEVASAFEVSRSAGLWPMKQPLSFTYVLKEKRLVERALYNLTVNRLVSRQGSIIEISFCLSTARGKKFHRRDSRTIFPAFRPKTVPPQRDLPGLGSSLRGSTFNNPLSLR